MERERERARAVAELPVTYQHVLDHLEAGTSHEQIALQLAIDPDALASMIHLAEAKLARLTDDPADRSTTNLMSSTVT